MASPKVRELLRLFRQYAPRIEFNIMPSAKDPLEAAAEPEPDDEQPVSSPRKSHRSKVHFEDADADGECGEKAGSESGEEGGGGCVEPEIFTQSYKAVASGGGGKLSEDKLCALVFVARPFLAHALNRFVEEICKWEPELSFVRSEYLVSSEPSDARRIEQTLRRLWLQETTVLFVTFAAFEEFHADLPQANLMVLLDPPATYKAYILSKAHLRPTTAAAASSALSSSGVDELSLAFCAVPVNLQYTKLPTVLVRCISPTCYLRYIVLVQCID